MKTDTRTLGARLAAIRVERGLSLWDAADKLGHSTDFLAHIESGNEPPAEDTLRKMATVYGCSIEELRGLG